MTSDSPAPSAPPPTPPAPPQATGAAGDLLAPPQPLAPPVAAHLAGQPLTRPTDPGADATPTIPPTRDATPAGDPPAPPAPPAPPGPPAPPAAPVSPSPAAVASTIPPPPPQRPTRPPVRRPAAHPETQAPTHASPTPNPEPAAHTAPTPEPPHAEPKTASTEPAIPVAAVPSRPAPVLGEPLLFAGGSSPDEPAPAAPAGPRRRRPIRMLLALALLAGFGAAAWFGYRQISIGATDDGGTDGAAPAPAPAPAADEPATLFDETQQLVDDINARPGVADALESLGLDATGEPAAPAAGDQPSAQASPVASYEFAWVDPFGLSVAVEVDVATGDYVAVTSDGTEIRRVGDRYFGSSTNTTWVELSPSVIAGVPVIGIDGQLDIDGVMPAEVAEFVVAAEQTADGVQRLLVDDASLAANEPSLRARWLAPWGLLDESAPDPPTAAADGVPAAAEPGQVVVSIRRGPDGSLAEVELSSPAIGGAARYTLVATSPDPLVVAIPESPAGG